MRVWVYITVGALVIIFALLGLWKQNQFALPSGETGVMATDEIAPGTARQPLGTSSRTVLTTDGVLHSIPLDEILSGGPPKDGIPSIDDPRFVSTREANFLDGDDVGLGLVQNGAAKFYPYQILVW